MAKNYRTERDWKDSIIIGGGITGLTAGCVSGLPIFEAQSFPGGICASYYIKPREKTRHLHPPENNTAYRFEIGGGHWIFGADKEVTEFIHAFVSTKKYSRRSSVYFSNNKLFVPYPIQHNLKLLGEKISDKALKEIRSGSTVADGSMKEWLTGNFGLTLCKLFFYPFHNLYTAGLYEKIAPQDRYKSPVNAAPKIIKNNRRIGYNATFIYPKKGLDAFVQFLANKCDIFYNKGVEKIDLPRRRVIFTDKSSVAYQRLISTIPLNKITELAGLKIKTAPDPYTSVLVLNIGAVKGRDCPREHWLYIPDSKSGFFRVGFYSNVDASFLPKSSQDSNKRVSIYVERAFKGGEKPSEQEIETYSNNVVKELKNWGFIKDLEVLDANWIDVAYTWSWQGSAWVQETLCALQRNNIYQMGRYGRWKFQGIAESIKEGLSLNNNREFSRL